MRKWFTLIIVTSFVLIIDQVSKWWVVNNVVLLQTVPILEGIQPYLQITRTTNTGFAFGLAQGGNTIILILSSLITLGLLWMFWQTDQAERLQLVGLATIMAGALGNIIDRIRFEHVVDFVHIEIPALSISNVSNFADHFVIIGVIILLLDGFLSERSNTETEKNTDQVAAVVSED